MPFAAEVQSYLCQGLCASEREAVREHTDDLDLAHAAAVAFEQQVAALAGTIEELRQPIRIEFRGAWK